MYFAFLSQQSWLSMFLQKFVNAISKLVCFVFERARASRHFSLGKGHPMRNLKTSTGDFEGTKAMNRGH